jgi:hypothetical protein
MSNRERCATAYGDLQTIKDYLPSNYHARLAGNQNEKGNRVTIWGVDNHGWTLDGYVIPRLASALIPAREVVSLLASWGSEGDPAEEMK